jgi:imidazolonepropionase-like amidohydrolase/glyoxylase-like metal-dependent hydrolase (beta-lactamase superfamily II)
MGFFQGGAMHKNICRGCTMLGLFLLASRLHAALPTNPEWMTPIAPFHIAGNLYYVGSKDLASYLIVTPQGHMLINSSFKESVPLIRSSVEQLGFQFKDIKILLISHAHFDHDAGSAEVIRQTGAKYMVMDADVPVVESGGAADFAYGEYKYEPAKVDRVLHDGDEVKLGGTVLTAHKTAGHTPGCTTWTLKVKEAGRLLDTVIVGSWNVNPGFRLVDRLGQPASYPGIAADYRRTFAVLKSLPSDVFLGAHGAYFGMLAKLDRIKSGTQENVWIDHSGYLAAVAEREQAFETELKLQQDSAAQSAGALKPYISEDSAALVLMHVRVIDGSGAPPADDQRIDIEGGKISRVQGAKLKNAFPPGAKVLDLTGKTVIPGLVGMHEHLFYTAPERGRDGLPFWIEMIDSGPRLYLASGVTTARTAGSMEPYTDLSLKKLIDSGLKPGPKLWITGPYIGDLSGIAPQLHTLADPEDAGRTVDYWAAEGVTSFKAYQSIKADELKIAIEHAHAKGLKITGHLCAVGFREAAALGIDNLEHGIAVDTEFLPTKKPGICAAREALEDLAKNVDIDSAPVQDMIRDLVSHHVAVTSTLAVFEISVPNRPSVQKMMRAKDALSPQGWATYLRVRSSIAEDNNPLMAAAFKKEMQFERDFVKAGGLLLAGCDPTSFGGVLPGFGDQRGLELLVEAGFTPVEAIHIATENGAIFLGESARIGSIAAGKAADLVVISGNPAQNIDDVENVQMVLKDGIGFDPVRLLKSVQGMVGER